MATLASHWEWIHNNIDTSLHCHSININNQEYVSIAIFLIFLYVSYIFLFIQNFQNRGLWKLSLSSISKGEEERKMFLSMVPIKDMASIQGTGSCFICQFNYLSWWSLHRSACASSGTWYPRQWAAAWHSRSPWPRRWVMAQYLVLADWLDCPHCHCRYCWCAPRFCRGPANTCCSLQIAASCTFTTLSTPAILWPIW